MQLQRRKKTILGNISFLGQSTVRERHRYNIKSKTRYQAGNQNSTTYTLSTLECDWQSALCYQQARVPDFSASIISLFAHDKAFRHPSWVRLSALCLREKKITLRPATYSVVIFKCQMVKHITVGLKHVEQNSFEGLHVLIQQLSERFSNVTKNNIHF